MRKLSPVVINMLNARRSHSYFCESVTGEAALLAQIAGKDEQTRIAALQSIKLTKAMDRRFRKRIFLAVEMQMALDPSPQIRRTAVRAAMDNIDQLPFANGSLCHFFRAVLQVAQGDSDSVVRVAALKLLQRMMESVELAYWADISAIATDLVTNAQGLREDVAQGGGGSMRLSSLVFCVLSRVANNDTHREVRLAALRAMKALPSLPLALLRQGLKKDMQLSMETSRPEEPLPLLVCGVFVHGIEDQFATIRFAALDALLSQLLLLLDIDNRKQREVALVFPMAVAVFIDALLDESDWIRLAALKIIATLSRVHGKLLHFSLDMGLEAILAVLDDTNAAIRREALSLLRHMRLADGLGDVQSDGLTPSKVDSHSEPTVVPSAFADAVLRTLWCLEAAVKKCPETESLAIMAAHSIARRHHDAILRSPGLLAHLLHSSDPKFFAPSIGTALSSVHLAMQAPFIPAGRVNLIRLLATMDANDTRDIDTCEIDSHVFPERMRLLADGNSPAVFDFKSVTREQYRDEQLLYKALVTCARQQDTCPYYRLFVAALTEVLDAYDSFYGLPYFTELKDMSELWQSGTHPIARVEFDNDNAVHIRPTSLSATGLPSRITITIDPIHIAGQWEVVKLELWCAVDDDNITYFSDDDGGNTHVDTRFVITPSLTLPTAYTATAVVPLRSALRQPKNQVELIVTNDGVLTLCTRILSVTS